MLKQGTCFCNRESEVDAITAYDLLSTEAHTFAKKNTKFATILTSCSTLQVFCVSMRRN